LFDSIAVRGYAAGMLIRYPGGKSGAGVYQRIISQMPPHEVYVEPFLGGGAVMRRKLPACWNYGIDLDGDVVRRAADLVGRGEWVPARALPVGSNDGGPRYYVHEGDGVAWLQSHRLPAKSLVYCDPPYLMSTRSSQRRIYRFELEVAGHIALLEVLVRLPCLVMVSGYPSELYSQALSSWRVVRYLAMTRGGSSREECLWCNFPEPAELHDYRYLGRDYRERERIRRKQARWVARLSAMTVLERRAVESALLTVRSQAAGS
jgi:hypothetical protein